MFLKNVIKSQYFACYFCCSLVLLFVHVQLLCIKCTAVFTALPDELLGKCSVARPKVISFNNWIIVIPVFIDKLAGVLWC